MKKFRNRRGIERVQRLLDKIARWAWEPFYKNEPDYPRETGVTGIFDRQGNRVNPLWKGLDYTMGVFRAEIGRHGGKLPPEPEQKGQAPRGVDFGRSSGGWTDFEFEAIASIAASDAITSIADATLKTTALLKVLTGSTPSSRGRYLFRGQSNITYTVVPRLGRNQAAQADFSPVTALERNAMAGFKAAWPVSDADQLDLRPGSVPGDDAAEWWWLMQHYGSGTRLLDVTTSLLFALLFACVRWGDGLVADEANDEDAQDGVVYLFPESGNAIVHDLLSQPVPPLSRIFESGPNDEDTPRMIFNPSHNERSKAQSGGFVWWPKFWEPYPGSPFFLRVPVACKREIARELLAFGVGPKEAVRGAKGLSNEHALRQDLGLRPL